MRRCRKWQTGSPFAFSGNDLLCNNSDLESKLREKFGEDEPFEGIVQMQRGKYRRDRIFRACNPFVFSPGEGLLLKRRNENRNVAKYARLVALKNGVYSQALIFFVFLVLQ